MTDESKLPLVSIAVFQGLLSIPPLGALYPVHQQSGEKVRRVAQMGGPGLQVQYPLVPSCHWPNQTPGSLGSLDFLSPGRGKEMGEHWQPFYNIGSPAILVMAVRGRCSQGRSDTPRCVSCRARP